MVTVLLSILMLFVACALLGLRVLLVRGGEFRGTCATNNPYLRDETGECGACGRQADESCPGWGMQRLKTFFRRSGPDRSANGQ